MKILFIDTETGGLDSKRSALIQLSGVIRVDKKDVETFNYFIKPFKGAEVSEEALAVQKRTKEDFNDSKFQSEEEVYRDFIKLLDKYIDKYDRNDKFVVAGYNVSFDVRFLQEFFKRNNDNYLYSYLSKMELDPFRYIPFLQLCGKLPILPNNKLETWCSHFGIELDAHDSLNDIIATKDLILQTTKLLK
ncbi:exonuclease domain-containing protein [Fusobacterium sp.]|uniref:3'-5' exonuclease n=1 Tax=Fusobacterium sp. TaxID=68766 RepID=UPI00396CBE1B